MGGEGQCGNVLGDMNAQKSALKVIQLVKSRGAAVEMMGVRSPQTAAEADATEAAEALESRTDKHLRRKQRCAAEPAPERRPDQSMVLA